MARPTNRHWSASLPDNPTYSNNLRSGWTYNENGQVASRDGEQKVYTYDASGQETHYWEQISHSLEPWFVQRNTIDQTYDGDGRRVKRYESRQRENAGGTETESDTTYYLTSSALGGATVIEMVPAGYGTKEHFYVGSQKIAERNTDSGYIGWRHVNPVTGSWLNTFNGGGGPNVNRNELDPLGTDVGLGDPYVTVTATYSDMMGPVSLYEERGNPFDPGGGCGTLDGIPISCSEKRQRMIGGSITQEVTLTDGRVRYLAIENYGVGIQRTLRTNELETVSKRDFLIAELELNDPLGGLGGDFTGTSEPQKSFSDCVNDNGLGGIGFTEEAANLIQNINELEGTSRELLAVTWKNENSFRMRPGPNTKSGAANWMLWDVGPFHINIKWTMRAAEKGEVSDRGLIKQNIFGYSFYRSDGKTPVSEFDGSPQENGQMAARRLNAFGGSDEDKVAAYAPEYGRAHRRRDFKKYAKRFRDFFKCYRRR